MEKYLEKNNSRKIFGIKKKKNYLNY